MNGENGTKTDIVWIKETLTRLEAKIDSWEAFQQEHGVTKEDCGERHDVFTRKFETLERTIDRRFKETAPKTEFNIVKTIVFGFSGVILLYAVRGWVQQLFASIGGGSLGGL